MCVCVCVCVRVCVCERVCVCMHMCVGVVSHTYSVCIKACIQHDLVTKCVVEYVQN